MSHPLAIFSPDDLGEWQTPFTRRHIQNLLPGRTIVAAPSSGPAPNWDGWAIDFPVLNLRRVLGERLRWQVAHGVAKQFGVLLDQFMIRRFLERYQCEVILSEYLDFSLQWLESGRRSGARFFAHAHGHDISGCLTDPRWREAYRRYNDSAGVITMNQPSREALLELGLAPEKVHVVHYGVEVPAAAEPHPEEDEIACFAVGRMVPQKAPILLLDAFRRAAECCPRLRLDYVGRGPLLPAVEQYVRAFGLADRVRLHGWQSNTFVRAAMRKAAMFLQHSMTDPHNGDQEGLPVAILEAMAVGLPVVSTLHAGIPEEVEEGITGYLVPEGDSAAMADRIVALARDPAARRRLGLAGHARAREHFTWERERAELLRILGLESAAA
jgi:glycosyltransferase involved in cell wall biosynthesis